jgi:hypothetical protein
MLKANNLCYLIKACNATLNHLPHVVPSNKPDGTVTARKLVFGWNVPQRWRIKLAREVLVRSRDAPTSFPRMIVVSELARLK